MKKRGIGRISVLLILVAAVFCFAAAAAGIFAQSGKNTVPLLFSEEFSSPDKVSLIPLEEDRYLLCVSRKENSLVMVLDESGQTLSTLTVPYYIQFPLYGGERVFLVSPYEDEKDSQTYEDEKNPETYENEKSPQTYGVQVLSYSFAENELALDFDIKLPQIYVQNRNDFAVDAQGRFYAAHTPVDDSMLIFSRDTDLIQTVPPASGKFRALAVSPDQTLYTMYSDEGKLGVLPLPDVIEEYSPLGEIPLHESELPRPEFRFLGEDIVVDGKGDIYQVQSQSLMRVTETKGDSQVAALLPEGEVLIKTGKAKACTFAEGQKTAEYRFAGELWALANHEEGAAAIVQQGQDWYFTPVTDSMRQPIDDQPDSSETSESSQSGSEPSSQPDGEEGLITGEDYRIDRENQRIYVEPKTTYAVLKSRIHTNSALLRAEKPNGVTLASGYVMTGAVLFAETDGQVTDSLTVIVPGDLTGTGTVTETGSKILYRVLNETAQLEEAYFAAADMDGDGELTTVDLLALKKKLKNIS